MAITTIKRKQFQGRPEDYIICSPSSYFLLPYEQEWKTGILFVGQHPHAGGLDREKTLLAKE